MKSLTRILFISCLITLTLCQQETGQEHAGEHAQENHLTVAQVWGFGILAGIGISLIGFLAAVILLIAKKCCLESHFIGLIKFFFSLAFGALLGDAIVHILAEAYQNQLTDKKIVSLIFILSIVSFLLIDRIMHAYGVAHSHWIRGEQSGCVDHNVEKNKKVQQAGHGHGHHHEHDHNCQGQLNPQGNFVSVEQISPKKDNKGKSLSLGSQGKIMPQDANNTKQQDNENDKEEEKGCCRSLRGKDSIGYMNLLGSFIHNFIDGLALGVAFATANPLEIVPVIIAIIAHEIPRQLGDVAVLLKSRFSEAQTVLCNGVVNFVSLIGVIIGLAVINLDKLAKTYIMVYVAGNFVYIAADIWQNLFKNKGEGAKCKNLIEFVGATIGIGSMFALTYLENPDTHNH